jgi:hypothetical protein
MKFVTLVDKDKFELFALSAHIAGDVVVMKFGPEKITCNRICEDGNCLFSGEYIYTQSTIAEDQIIHVGLSTCELVKNLAQMPSGGLSIGVDNVGDFIMVVGGFKISMTPITPCPESDEVTKEEYPIIFSVDTEHLANMIAFTEADSKELSSIILSVEDDGLYMANQDWSSSSVLHDVGTTTFVFFEKRTPGKFSVMIDYKAFKNIITAMSVYTSIKVALGEDMPLIILGYDEQVRLAYMIAPQVEEEEEDVSV